jgi:hypothetical protein
MTASPDACPGKDGPAGGLLPGWDESDEHARFNYGLGLTYFLTENVNLRADVWHILVDGDWTKMARF